MSLPSKLLKRFSKPPPTKLSPRIPRNSNFHSSNKTTRYYLNRNLTETTRLNHQHNLITNTTFLIHPQILSSLSPSPKIADFATGTAIWPLQVSSLLPNAQVTGFDISDKQFPPRRTLPSNVKLLLGDILDEGRLEGEYDLVNVRALVSVLENREWEVVVRNLVRTLKPGGWIQWVDGDLSPQSYRCIPTTNIDSTHDLPLDDNPLSHGIKVYHKWAAHLKRNLATCHTLPSLFATNNEYTPVLTEGIASIISHWAADIRAETRSGQGIGKMDITPDEIENAAREMVRFSRKGKVLTKVDFHAVAGRKILR